MTAKQYLRQAYRLNELIDSDLEELDQLRDLASSVSSSNLSGMPHSPNRDVEPSFVRCLPKIIDLENKINDEIDKYVDLKEEIRSKIEQIPDKNERLILQNRYLLFHTWEVIAEELNFTTQWVHEIHKRALQDFSKNLIPNFLL